MASSSQSPFGANNVRPYRMHVSQKYLDLTKQKLELTRLPREAVGQMAAQQQWTFGISKSDLEPLVDYWMEEYDWRNREKYYNDTLPQFRAAINGTRLHFVHRRSDEAAAVPLLFIHGYPESFATVAKTIDSLCNPVATPPRGVDGVPAFHLVAPSIPGFGFSDPVPEEGNAMTATASIFDTLMRGLGYPQYMVHGSGWAFNVCRALALSHPNSCIAIHTVNPEVPAPRPAFGYTNQDMSFSGLPPQSPGLTPPLTPGSMPRPNEKPQTTAYALCDSPTGLLAYMLEAIKPETITEQLGSPRSAGSSSGGHSPAATRSPYTPLSAMSTPGPILGRSPQTPQNLELTDLTNPWCPSALIDWTMLYWLPGPEVALRWLANSAALVPSLWLGHSNVPLGITHFREATLSGSGTGQTPPQWAEAYHRVAMLRRREGRVRFPAWERPAEVVEDLRELASIVMPSVTHGVEMMSVMDRH